MTQEKTPTPFQLDAAAKQAAYEAKVLPNMRRIREYYSQKHGFGIVDKANRTR